MQLDVLEPPELSVTLVGVHVDVKPVDGAIVHDNVREPANPLRLPIVMLEEPDEPGGNVTVAGLAVRLKSGEVFAVTVTLMATE